MNESVPPRVPERVTLYRCPECGYVRDGRWGAPPYGCEGKVMRHENVEMVPVEYAPVSSGDPTGALRLCLEALDRHDAWCGHNPDAPGDGIINRARDAADAVLRPVSSGVDEEKGVEAFQRALRESEWGRRRQTTDWPPDDVIADALTSVSREPSPTCTCPHVGVEDDCPDHRHRVASSVPTVRVSEVVEVPGRARPRGARRMNAMEWRVRQSETDPPAWAVDYRDSPFETWDTLPRRFLSLEDAERFVAEERREAANEESDA